MKKMGLIFGLFLLIAAMMLSLGLEDSLDARFYYSDVQGIQFLKSLSADQAEIYFTNELIDLVLFIPTYTALLVMGLSKIASGPLVFLGYGPAFFDLIETANVLWALKSSPENLLPFLGLITALKWSLALLCLLIFVGGVIKNVRTPN